MQTNRVKNPRKQRKRFFNAPAHIRHKGMSSPLSKELAAQKGIRSLPVRKGDTVHIQRGDNKGFEGKISRVDMKNYRIFLEGLTREKVDGTNIFLPVHPSKVMIRTLNLDDKWRKNFILGRKGAPEKPAAARATKPKKVEKPQPAVKPEVKVEEVKVEVPAEKPVVAPPILVKPAVKPKVEPKVAKEEAPAEVAPTPQKAPEKAVQKAPAKKAPVKKTAAKKAKPVTAKVASVKAEAPAEEPAKVAKKPVKSKAAPKKKAPAEETVEKAASKPKAKRKAPEKTEGGK
jgi:large subunit ribosomal protein L24